MELRSAAEFVEVAAAEGLDGGRGHLTYAADEVERRFWDVPDTPEMTTALADALLRACGAWDEVWMDPSSLDWGGIFADGSDYGDPWHQRLRTHRVPVEYRGAVRFTRQERAEAVELLADEMFVGQTRMCDLRVLCRPGDVSLYVEHHAVVWVHTRTAEAMDRLVAEIEARGFPLPDDYPDDTFKPVSWMKPLPEHID
jgi:hypothetical protein